MSSTNAEDAQKQEHVEDTGKDQVHEDSPENDPINLTLKTCLQEEVLKKKYGGILPKKTHLISKDHECAFFDSADWALGEPKGPLEALRPKLRQARSRRSAYALAGEGEDGGSNLGSNISKL
ncbi:hypothetical protein MKW92_003084 [Papaver armeniacum]|nr:hypothetical protein MKW92_003084 [Papaver armeniacum]